MAQDDFMNHRGARSRVRMLLTAGTAMLAILASGAASALGLGQATVNSYLNQPLNARIDLISRSEAEMATVTAGLASPADFQVMGLTRSAISIPLDFTISRDLADPHVRVTSTQAIEEPVVQLVVEVVWASGRMLRQYTLFLDPATFVAPAPLPAIPAPRTADTTQKPVPAAEAAPIPPPEPEIATVEPVASTTTTFDESSLSTDSSLPTLPSQEPVTEPVVESVAESVAEVTVDDPAPADSVPPRSVEDFGEIPEEPARLADAPANTDSPESLPSESDIPQLQEADVRDEAQELVAEASPPEEPVVEDLAGVEPADPPAAEENPAVASESPTGSSEEALDSLADASDAAAEVAQPTELPPEIPVDGVNDEAADALDEAPVVANRDELLAPVDADSESTDLAGEAETPELELNDEQDPVALSETASEAEAEQELLVSEAIEQASEQAPEQTQEQAAVDELVAVEPEAPIEVAETAPEIPEADDPSPVSDELPGSDAVAQESDAPAELAESVPPVSEPVAIEPEASELVYRAVIPDSSAPAAGGTVDVERGDTLWGISKAYAEAQGLGVNQVMLAVQQKNPGAFLDDNINRLMAGEVLRMPEANEIQQFSAREAMLEVMRQEALYRTRWDVPQNPGDIPTVSNFAQQSSQDEPVADEAPEAFPEDSTALASNDPVDDSLLVLVPPSEGENEEGMGQGNDGASDASEGVSVVEELARTQEELANAQQENAYLADRISELEAALERDAADDGEGVGDTNLAEMEDRLREERTQNEGEAAPVKAPEEEVASGSLWIFLLAVIASIFGVVMFLRSRRGVEFLPAGENFQSKPDEEAAESPAPEDEPLVEKVVPLRERRTLPPEPEPEAVEMDLEDPETKLDLARAYMAMGKSAEAKDLLEGVIRDGNEDQEREAREMLSEL